MTAKSDHIERIYTAALSRGEEAERAAYLDSACAGDTALRARIESLLKAYDKVGTFLETPPPFVDAPTFGESLKEGSGTIIGRYKLLERIGEGGMAVVYMAEQEQPIRRKVALKIIKLGMDTRQVVARFEAERQALAMMDHPNIAKVFDAGATETGRPYFVMELVQGVSITDYCDKNRLSTKDRLALFVQVCSAVQHAHQKGIIHRDIKPSNVMVTMHDGKPVPKVIDFGIAKATNQRLTEKTLFTRYAQIVGTPAYMSPEQAELSDIDVDTRSDIYSLGVLLYELLTGTTPFSEQQLREAGYVEMQRVIREEEPTKPSTKLSTLGDNLKDIAERRRCNPDLLRKTLRGDLDWIAMKALKKDRAHRYDGVASLALDIQRHLQDKPVAAHAPNALYGLGKFLRRHRTRLAASLMLAVLTGSVTVTLWMWNAHRVQIQAARDRSVLAVARQAYARGDLGGALATIKSILPSKHVGPEAQLLHASILVDGQYPEEAMVQLKSLVRARPEIAGAAHALWARALSERETTDANRFDEINGHLRQAEVLLPATAEAYYYRAMAAVTIREKLVWLEKALSLDRGHFESCRMRAFIDLASKKYERMRDDALVMVAKQPQNPLGYQLRGMALQGLGEYEEALAEYDRALQLLAVGDPRYSELSARMCEVHLCRGDYDGVIEQVSAALPYSADKAKLNFEAFCALTAQGQYEEAHALFERIIADAPDARQRLRYWAWEYVFDTLEAGRTWHPQDAAPQDAAFLPLVEAEEDYAQLSAKAERIVDDGFTARWSPDGTRLAYSLGMLECSGLALYDAVSRETELLIVPGKDPAWSPDGRYIAFCREARRLPLAELAVPEQRTLRRSEGEIWITNIDGPDLEPKRLTRGFWPSWSQDGKAVYFVREGTLYSIAFEDPDAVAQPILACPGSLPSVSPNGQYVAYVQDDALQIWKLNPPSRVRVCPVPPLTWGGHWSPDNHQFSLGSLILPEVRTGLWIYDLDTDVATKTLSGQVTSASWSPDASRLALSTLAPSFDIWLADVDPAIPIGEALDPALDYDEHFQELVTFYTRRIEADGNDLASVLHRAECYHHLHDSEDLMSDLQQSFDSVCPGPPPAFRDFVAGLWQTTASILGPEVNSTATDRGPSVSADGLRLYFDSNRSGGSGGLDLWITTRDTKHDTWQVPRNLGAIVNSRADDWTPSISADGLSLYFASNRDGGLGDFDIYVATRATTEDEWGRPVNLGPTVNSPLGDGCPCISADGLTLFFGSFRAGGYGLADLWMTRRPNLTEPWGVPLNLGSSVNGPDLELDPAVSSDGLLLLFDTRRARSAGGSDLWVVYRESVDSDWSTPMNLGPVINKQGDEGHADLSSDGSTLYFSAMRSGGMGIWQARILLPSPDDQ